MENKAIQIEPKAATEMQSWTNIYDRVPSQYRQYVSYPTTTMKECPSKAEINSKLTHACTTDSNELTDYSSIKLNFSEREELTSDSLAENWMHNSTTQRDIQLRYGTTILLNQLAIHQNIQDYTSNYVTKITGQSQYFEVLQLDRGILRVRPLYGNQTNMMRTCTVAVTAMGKTTYIYLSQDANPLGNKRSIVIINGSIASKTIQINDDTVVLNPKDVWTKSYYDTTPIDVITQTNLEFRMIHSEGDSKNNNSQWIFPDENLNAQAGNYLLTVSQTHKLYLVSVFYITQ